MRLERMQGAWTALVTPFRQDGEIDWEGYEKNLEFQIAQGIDGLLPCGTTGESPALSWQEHNAVIDKAIRVAGGRRPVLAGVGSNSTAEALRAAEHAAQSGADAFLLVDCYYNGPSSLELRQCYHAVVAEAFPDVAVIPYIIPGRTGCAMAPEDLAILAGERPNVIGVKEATGDLERMARTRVLCGPEFAVMSGDDNLTHEMMTDPQIRADGVISVISNVAPGGVARMTAAALAGDLAEARRLQDALAPLFDLVTVTVENERVLPDGAKTTVRDKFRNPLAIKTMMAGLGMPAGPTRKPLGRMTRNAVERVRGALRQVRRDSPEILQPIADHFGADIDARLEDDDVWAGLAAAV